MIIPLFLVLIWGFCASAYTERPEITDPPLKLQFTPTNPRQTAPTSTVWGAIVTSYLNVVDCDRVTVENIDDNTAPSGQFTTRTTSPWLVVYRIGCIQKATDTTRRDYQGFELEKSVVPRTASPGSDLDQQVSYDASADVEGTTKDKRSESAASIISIILSMAQQLSGGIDPTNENITVKEFRYLEELNTALFGLNLVNSGLPLNETCKYLQDPANGETLENNLIDRVQASNIVCFAAMNGIFFGMSNNELLKDLSALEFAIQMHSYGSESVKQLCADLDYRAAQALGIDVQGIYATVCNSTGGVMPSSAPSPPLTTGPMTTAAGNPGTGAPMYVTTSTSMGSGPAPRSSSSIIFGSNGLEFSSATSAAGTVAPWWNTTMATVTPESLPTVTASAGVEASATIAAPAFYNPPQLVRDRVRRHNPRPIY